MSVYATESEVKSMIKFIPDTPTPDMMERVLLNADSLINSRLISHSIPISCVKDTDDFEILKTAAVYYAASDVLLSLFTNDDLPAQYDAYYNKAESLLESYINKIEFELAQTELKNKSTVSFNRVPSYYERKGRKRRC